MEFNLDSAVETQHGAQHLDSPIYLKIWLVTNKVTTQIFNTICKSICYTPWLRSTAESRLKNLGFSLIELMVVLVIIAICTMIAVPVYTSQLTKAKRSDGKMALLDLASRMERYYVDYNTFETATIATGEATDVLATNTSLQNYYKLSIVKKSPTSFVIQATPEGEEDVQCGSFRLNQLGQQSITGQGKSDYCWR